jgi:hypothetical protein
MGSKYPREWFEAFQARGGTGEYVLHPPFGDDGHNLFTRGFELWKPMVERFLAGVQGK